MKVRKSELSEKERIETLDALYTAASAIQGRSAVKDFLKSVLTESERLMIGRRIIIARALLLGESPEDIARRMRVGYDTIYRVSTWLDREMPGYRDALRGLEQTYGYRAEKRSRPRLGEAGYLKKKYPLYFMFFPAPKKKTPPKKNYDIS